MLSGKKEFCNLLAAFLVFRAIPANFPFGGLLRASDRVKPVVRVLHSMNSFLSRGLITPDLFL